MSKSNHEKMRHMKLLGTKSSIQLHFSQNEQIFRLLLKISVWDVNNS